MAQNASKHVLVDAAAITATGSTTSTAVTLPHSARIAHFFCGFDYGSDGTTVKVYVQTKVFGTWWDVACFAHGTATLNRWVTVNAARAVDAVTPVVPVPVALSTVQTIDDDTAVDGLSGSEYRVQYVVSATPDYAGTTLDVTMLSYA